MKTKNKLLHHGLSLLTAGAALLSVTSSVQAADKKPNIVIIWGDDVGQSDISAYSMGLMGFKTPNIDRVAKEGVMFTDYYAEQSCTAGRSSFITGQLGLRTGNTKVGMPGAAQGLQARDVTIAQMLKPLGYATGQFGKNHLGDRNEHLPTVHGFDEFYGALYHLNASEEPELPDYPKPADYPNFLANFGPRNVLDCKATTTDDATVDKALHGAWDVVPRIIDVYGFHDVTPGQITRVLDSYVHDLAVTNTAHDLYDEDNGLAYRLRSIGLPVYLHQPREAAR